MSTNDFKYLFGPVPSRRLGRSLGIDLIPFKTCSFDCIFCQLGRTTEKTTERRDDVPVTAVLTEFAAWLDGGGGADYITIAGGGEPTLHRHFGDVIDGVHETTGIPVALLTNGSLLSDPEVRAEAARADIVKISLSAWDQFSFDHVNRPAAGMRFAEMLRGQQQFRREYAGRIWLEVFLLAGTNSTPADVSRIAELAATIAPDRVQLNTAVRPPCESYARPVPTERLEALAALFDPPAEVIAEFSSAIDDGVEATETEIANLLDRRPCTLEQVCTVFALHRNEASKYIGKLLRQGRAVQRRRGADTYYCAVHPGSTDNAHI